MPFLTFRSILVATDLREGSDEIMACAAKLVEAFGAELHVVHALDPSGSTYQSIASSNAADWLDGADLRHRAEVLLARQIARIFGAGVALPDARVLNDAPHHAIVEYARRIGCDLVVLGPHRGGAVGAHFLGTTADRVVRTADIPCLVVSGECAFPIDRIGVPLDFSGPARGALDVALAFGSALAGTPAGAGTTRVRIFHVGWPVDRMDDPEVTERILRPRLEAEAREALDRLDEAGRRGLEVDGDVAWEVSPVTGITDYARAQQLGLLVMGTQGATGLRRLLIGSVASGVARSAPCPVLLVPPSLTRKFFGGRRAWEHQARLDRVLIAIDLKDASFAAAAWAVDEFASGAEIVLVHVVEAPRRPAFAAGDSGGREEAIVALRAGAEARVEDFVRSLRHPVRLLVREGRAHDQICEAAAESGANVLVVGEHASRGGVSGWLGSTAESLLGTTPIPLLLAHRRPPSRPQSILAAVDESDLGIGVLVWARFFAERFQARLQVISVLDLLGGDLASVGTMEDDLARGRVWLRGRAREAGLDLDEDSLITETGRPADAILDTTERLGSDLLVVGSRGASTAGRLLVGSVAAEVLRRAPCPVFVVEHPQQSLDRKLGY